MNRQTKKTKPFNVTKASPLDIKYAKRLNEATEVLGVSKVDAVLLDLSLPDSEGIDTFIKLRDSSPETPIVVLSGTKDEDIAVQAGRHPRI